ncbi:MAG: HD domain-containing protein [Candidatus Gracilibacteria bacterium]|nr:HD domain-containing protein [Candidatus Gracilibacteria bacterium]
MKEINSIIKKLEKIGKKVYIVGGYPRSKILGIKYNGDIDLSTDATPEEIEKVLLVITEVGKKYGTLIIKEGKKIFEITTFREDIGILNHRKPVKVKFTKNLELDSKRRDFTMNAIYYNPVNDSFIDPENGITDLKNNNIKFVGIPENRINEDALRILRFIRFKNKYNLKCFDKDYFSILKNNINLLKNISIERIKEEFEKILLLENNINALQELKLIGFFEIFFPEIDLLEKTPGGPRHHLEGNVWIHTLKTIEELNKIIKRGFLIPDKTGKETKLNLSKNEKTALYRTMLLHDIGKHSTFSKDENGNVHYLKHELIGLEKFNEMKKRFIFTNKEKEIINYLIENHLKLYKISEMRTLKSRKFMMHKYFPYLMIIGICDHLGRIPAKKDLIINLKIFYKDFMIKLNNKKFITGKEVIKKYPNLKGSEIKKKIDEINDNILIK